jgi:murein DD-endopeptidase MepM/ murein hydrolase activator NlpD
MAGRQGESKFTVMVVPHSQQPPVAFRLPLTLMKFLGTALVFVPLVLVGFFNSYHSARAVMPELEDLRLDNQLKSEQIERLAEETQKILDDLQRLRLLEKRLLEITEIDDISQGSQITDDADEGRNFRRDMASRSFTTVDRALSGIQSLQEDLPEQEKKFAELKGAIEEQLRREAATPSIWPAWGNVTSGFGWRVHPIYRNRHFHTGIDIGGRNINGAGVYATANGRVAFAGFQGGYGNLIIIDHGYGITTFYAHLSRIQVRVGQQVEKGQLIGNVGSTGLSTAPHLHYEVRKWNQPQNPRQFLP